MKVAIIPARGGSKRIPEKNIREFAGKPMIAWSVIAAIKSNIFDRVIVSTDNQDIAYIANLYGAETPFIRPVNLSDDFTGTHDVIKHAIHWLNDSGCAVDYACCIYATAPFVKPEYLSEGFDKLNSSGKAFAFSVTSFPFPVQRSLRITGNGQISVMFPQYINSRSQDLEQAYHDAGQFYWGSADAYLNDIELFSKESIPVQIPRYLVQDIDTMEDWKKAELMFNALLASGVISL